MQNNLNIIRDTREQIDNTFWFMLKKKNGKTIILL